MLTVFRKNQSRSTAAQRWLGARAGGTIETSSWRWNDPATVFVVIVVVIVVVVSGRGNSSSNGNAKFHRADRLRELGRELHANSAPFEKCTERNRMPPLWVRERADTFVALHLHAGREEQTTVILSKHRLILPTTARNQRLFHAFCTTICCHISNHARKRCGSSFTNKHTRSETSSRVSPFIQQAPFSCSLVKFTTCLNASVICLARQFNINPEEIGVAAVCLLYRSEVAPSPTWLYSMRTIKSN